MRACASVYLCVCVYLCVLRTAFTPKAWHALTLFLCLELPLYTPLPAAAFAVVPALSDIIGRCLPMLGMIRHDNMRWVFSVGAV